MHPTKPALFDRVVGRLRCRRRFASTQKVEEAERAFYQSHLGAGAIAFDVGASVGTITVLFSKLVGDSGKVHAFEPGRTSFERLRSTCEAAGARNVVLNRLALIDKEEDVQINIYDSEHQSWNTLATRPLARYGLDVKPVGTETVHGTTVDRYCEQQVIQQIDLLKIDVEGVEYQVLLGAQRMFHERRIHACVFEFGATTFDAGNRPEDIRAYLAGMNYTLTNLVANDPVFPGEHSAATASFSMHLAMPR